MQPSALILRTAGTNCDAETAYAFEKAGFRAERLHINRILESPTCLRDFQSIAIPGGFSYGDDIAAGRIFANQIAHHLRDHLAEFIAAGKPIIGICNGFQVLVKTDLLPGPLAGCNGQTCTLTNNDNGRFIDRWVRVTAQSKKCIWTAGLDSLESLELPIAHGEGKFVPANQAVRQALLENDQIAMTYAATDNPNGSTDDIAGICDATGLILGLMPHPERHLSQLQHPAWTSRRIDPDTAGAGLRVFQNAFRYVSDGVGSGV